MLASVCSELQSVPYNPDHGSIRGMQNDLHPSFFHEKENAMDQIFKYLICVFFGLLTFLLGDSLHECPLLSVFLTIVGCFFTVYPLLSVLKLMLMYL